MKIHFNKHLIKIINKCDIINYYIGHNLFSNKIIHSYKLGLMNMDYSHDIFFIFNNANLFISGFFVTLHIFNTQNNHKIFFNKKEYPFLYRYVNSHDSNV